MIHSHVKNVDISMSLEVFARILNLSCEDVGIFHVDLDDFEMVRLLSLLPDCFMMMIIQS